MTMPDFKNIWPKYMIQNIIYTQLAHIGNKYNYAMWKTNQLKQGVAMTGRNTTGPPRAAPW